MLHEGPSAGPPWPPYTDHNPIEITLRVGKNWQPLAERFRVLATPDVSRMRRSSDVAVNLRQKWVEKVESQLLALQARPDWEQTCTICRSTAVEVCGLLHLHRGAPWLRFKGREVQQLDLTISQLQQNYRSARQAGYDPEPWRRQLHQARRHEARQLRQWEIDWLKDREEPRTVARTQQHRTTQPSVPLWEIKFAVKHTGTVYRPQFPAAQPPDPRTHIWCRRNLGETNGGSCKKTKRKTYKKWLCHIHFNLLSFDFSFEISTFFLRFYWHVYFFFIFPLEQGDLEIA